ncbi:D-TA family PLP-dependent enzyme [Arthrobacter agilis]|uniref:alanine racemase n=1 Tax=Arthrobacter agilis TaxID=37921 RepID=UPI000B352E4B|nr:alanine racemase [Arthrobacter agilis]OUM42188.1 alanine racemase [Arthrobacter agilis]PPB45533.1 alanine racemase [Arthrobacter agilis]TPV26491.1 D-TA family PLP-dependent enzyme [Arthrobacter agilis]
MPPPLDVPTPTVVIDAAVLERNIASMAQSARVRGLQLRPHAKTHKIPEIARLQLEAGAAGLTVATIGEAEVFADAGIGDVFIAYPLWVDGPAALRLLALAQRLRLAVGVDSVEGVRQLSRSLGSGAGRVAVRVEVDSGHHRSGVLPHQAVTVALAARSAGLRVTGLFTFPGHSYGPDLAAQAAVDEQEALAEAAADLRDAGFSSLEISGGSTPSARLGPAGVLTELRPGVYVFGDAQQRELGHCGPEDIALSVESTVVSRRTGTDGAPDRFVVDAGSKVLGSDRAAWATGHGRLLENPDARIVALSEHHATVELPAGQPLPALGSRLRVVPNHVCLTINLVDSVYVVRNGVVEGLWSVAARGRNS